MNCQHIIAYKTIDDELIPLYNNDIVTYQDIITYNKICPKCNKCVPFSHINRLKFDRSTKEVKAKEYKYKKALDILI